MAEETVLSTTVPETTTIDTGADKETIGNLNEAFSDFWDEQDKGGEAPAAPGEKEKPEPKETKPEPKLEPAEPDEVSPDPEEKAKELSDEDIDKMEVGDDRRNDSVANFKQIKELLKAERARVKAAESKRAEVERELAEAKQNSLTAEQKADYENASALRRRFDIGNDPQFVSKYQTPIQQKYHAILSETIDALPDRDKAAGWAQFMAENYSPDQLTKQWWQEKVLAMIPDDMDRESVRSSITEMIRLQKDRDGELSKYSDSQESYKQWNAEKDQTNSKEIFSEIARQEQRIKDYLPRKEDDAKTKEERQAIIEHNERFNVLNEHFKGLLQDAGSGPRGWVRTAIEATRAHIMDEEMKTLKADYKTACSERDKYKSELDRITGARRKLSHTTGTPPVNGQKKEGLTTKDLDVRKAFRDFDWGDST
jgi:hypothetical protein